MIGRRMHINPEIEKVVVIPHMVEIINEQVEVLTI